MLERWIVRHWIALCIGCTLMGISFQLSYAERGYIAFGAEWLIIPVAFAIETVYRNYRRRKRRRCRNMRI